MKNLECVAQKMAELPLDAPELMRSMKESAKLTHTGAMDPMPYFRIQYVPLRLI